MENNKNKKAKKIIPIIILVVIVIILLLLHRCTNLGTDNNSVGNTTSAQAVTAVSETSTEAETTTVPETTTTLPAEEEPATVATTVPRRQHPTTTKKSTTTTTTKKTTTTTTKKPTTTTTTKPTTTKKVTTTKPVTTTKSTTKPTTTQPALPITYAQITDGADTTSVEWKNLGTELEIASFSATRTTIPNDQFNGSVFPKAKNIVKVEIPVGITSIGDSAFANCDNLESITIPKTVTSIGANFIATCPNVYSVTFNGTVEEWNAVTKVTGWDTTESGIIIHCSDDCIDADGDPTYCSTHNRNGCILEGTLVTLSDGSTKAIENVTQDDVLQTFNFTTGSVDSNKVFYVMKHEDKPSMKFHIELSNGKTLDMADWQCFFDMNAREYFDVNSKTYQDAIGKTIMFIDNGTYQSVTITNITTEVTTCTSYEIFTEYNGNFVAGGVLTLEPDTILKGTYTITEDYKIDQDQLQRDIEQYGLYTYDDFKDYISESSFEKGNFAVKKISVGKGYTDEEWLMQLYGEFVPEVKDQNEF